jgi:type I restriction enzyme S subunit
MNEWKEYKLKDVANVKYGKAHQSLSDGYIPAYGSGGLIRYVEKALYNEESILIPRKGTLNNIIYKDEPFWTVDTMFWTELNKKIIVPKYLFYQLSLIDFSNMNVGSAVPSMTIPILNDIDIYVPSIPEQTAIASILSSLDDKIDLLHRQNATLEKMAETLFRQWFVEEAKEEWDEGTLDDILTVKGGSTPSTSEPAYWNGKIHWTSPKDITNLNGIYLFDTERKITELGLSKISSGLLPKGTLLMSSRAPVGVLAFCEVPVAINQGYIAILDNKGYSKEFIYLWLKANIDVVHSFSNGSTFMEISKTAFKTLQLQLPPKQVMTDFQLLVKPLFNKIKSNHIQIRTLTALRDTLLPKLMSGEVRVD